MWVGDFAPPARGAKKPISKKDLKKLKDAYAKADEIVQEAQKQEQAERTHAEQDMKHQIDNLL